MNLPLPTLSANHPNLVVREGAGLHRAAKPEPSYVLLPTMQHVEAEVPQVEQGSATEPACGFTTTAVAAIAAPPALRMQPVLVPEQTPTDYSFDLRQQWEGVVVSLDKKDVGVVLRDLLRPDEPELEVVLDIDEVAKDDLPLLAPGAVLYWSIGYEQTRTGQRKRVSTLRLRRLPAWSANDIARTQARARGLDDLFDE